MSETESSDTEQGGGGPGSDDAGSSSGDARTDQLITFQSLFPSMEAVYGAKVMHHHIDSVAESKLFILAPTPAPRKERQIRIAAQAPDPAQAPAPNIFYNIP